MVDGNVVRVLARLTVLNDTNFSSNAQAVKQFTVLANQLLNPKRPGDANQAMMELGATLCTKGQPQCECRPLKTFCLGFQAGKPEGLPAITRAKRTQVQRKSSLYHSRATPTVIQNFIRCQTLERPLRITSLRHWKKDSKHLKKLTSKNEGFQIK